MSLIACRKSAAGGFLALVAVLIVATTASGGRPARATGSEAKLQRALDRIVTAGAPGVLALVRDGGRTLRLASGYADLRSKRKMRADDRFRVGSVTKTFVATVVLQLAGEGTLTLEDTVDHWLPGLVPNGENITLRQLLTMRSGLFDYLNDGDTTVLEPYLKGDVTRRWTPTQLIEIATTHDPNFPPGTSYRYCNTCYILLGMIVEAATGNSVGAELKRRIFEPLHLRQTSFDAKPRIAGRHVHGYIIINKPALHDTTVLSPSWAWSAGAIVSTADDVARFYRALLRGASSRPSSWRRWRQPSRPRSGTATGWVSSRCNCRAAPSGAMTAASPATRRSPSRARMASDR